MSERARCVAWVSFDGDGNIISSHNVADVTRGGDAGIYYDVQFATPMPNTEYCVVATPRDNMAVAVNSYNRVKFQLVANGAASACGMYAAVFA